MSAADIKYKIDQDGAKVEKQKKKKCFASPTCPISFLKPYECRMSFPRSYEGQNAKVFKELSSLERPWGIYSTPRPPAVCLASLCEGHLDLRNECITYDIHNFICLHFFHQPFLCRLASSSVGSCIVEYL